MTLAPASPTAHHAFQQVISSQLGNAIRSLRKTASTEIEQLHKNHKSAREACSVAQAVKGQVLRQQVIDDEVALVLLFLPPNSGNVLSIQRIAAPRPSVRSASIVMSPSASMPANTPCAPSAIISLPAAPHPRGTLSSGTSGRGETAVPHGPETP